MSASAAKPVTARARAQQPRSPSELLEPARAPGAPRQRGRAKVKGGGPRRGAITLLNSTLTVLMVLGLLTGGSGYAMKYAFEQPGPLDHSAMVVIPPGVGVRGIATQLQREGVISDSRILLAGIYWASLKSYFTGGKPPNLKAGEYQIGKSASMRQVIDTLVDGKAVLAQVKVPEGLTSYQIVTLLNAQHDLTGEITEIPTEGSLLPETYKFARGTERKDVIARMQNDAKKFVAKQWETRSDRVPFKTVEEAIILASIVEKEARNERDRVAGVFYNRLAKHMRLQSDPTIIYVLTGGKGSLGRGITKTEIEAKNEYNTYQIEGLTPTPICNPGRAAIDAVLNPASTDDLFFVADGTGNHAFAATIRDHQNNVKRWRQVEREAKAKAAADAASPDQTAGPGVALEMPGVTVDNGQAAAATPAGASPAAIQANPEDVTGVTAAAAIGEIDPAPAPPSKSVPPKATIATAKAPAVAATDATPSLTPTAATVDAKAATPAKRKKTKPKVP